MADFKELEEKTMITPEMVDALIKDMNLDEAMASFFRRDQTKFLVGNFYQLLTVYIPRIIETNGFTSVVINGLKYGFSLKNVCAFNSGVHVSQCFEHTLPNRIPITADFIYDVVPLLAAEKNQPPRILSKVRAVVFYCPIPTGCNFLRTPVLEDPEPLDDTLNAGIFVCSGHMRSIPCIKSMLTNMILAVEKQSFYRVQVRCDHEGNHTIDNGNPYRSTSSIDFEVSKKLKRNALEGEIACKLPFSKAQVKLAILAQALGCSRKQFVALVKNVAGEDYDQPTFRCYEVDILYGASEIQDQGAAILYLANLSDKKLATTGMNLLKTELFPHLNIMFEKGNKEGLYFSKLFFLAMCTSTLILFVAGKYKETSRDTWQNASVVTPAFHIGMCIRARLILHMAAFAKTLRRESIRKFKPLLKNPNAEFPYFDLIHKFKQERLSLAIMTAVNSGKFSPKKQGISIQLGDNNWTTVLAQLLRIVSSLKTTDSTHIEPRKVPEDSAGYTCACDTTDGKDVGLDTILGCTSTITVDVRDPKALCELLELILAKELKAIVETLKPQTTQNVIILPDKPQPQQPTALNSNGEPFLNPASVVETVPLAARTVSVELISSVDFSLLEKDWYIYINACGVPTHFVSKTDVDSLVARFRLARRRGEISKHCFIKVSHKPRQIRILCEGGLICRPLIVLENVHKLLLEKNKKLNFKQMIHEGIIEYVNPAEERSLCKVAICLQDLEHAVENNMHHDITHLEFTEAAFVGLMAASIPFLTSIQGPRASYATHQQRQAMTAGVKRNRGSVQSTEIWQSNQELAFTKVAKLVPGAKDGRGFPTVTGFVPTDQNQEDAFETQAQSVDVGMFTAMTTRHYVSDIRAPTNRLSEKFERPTNVLSRKNQNFSAINADGFPSKRAKIAGDEIVIAKTRPVIKATTNNASQGPNGKKSRASKESKAKQELLEKTQPRLTAQSATTTTTTTKPNQGGAGNINNSAALNKAKFIPKRCISQSVQRDEAGSVRDVTLRSTPIGKRGRVSVGTVRRLTRGQKMTSRHSQKGVNGAVRSYENMCFSERTGMVPVLLASGLGVTSRMTMATLAEGIVSKAVAVTGNKQFGEDTNEYHKDNVVQIHAAGEALIRKGYKRNGAEIMRCGKTGKRMRGEVFIGVIEYHQLIHMACKKLHFRSHGPRCYLTRQAKQGKKNDGGLRWGELESAALVAQGGAAFLQSRFRDSDPADLFICIECQNLADGNKKTNYAWCTICQRRDTVHLVKYPYTLHLNLQEVAAIGVKSLFEIEPTVPLIPSASNQDVR